MVESHWLWYSLIVLGTHQQSIQNGQKERCPFPMIWQGCWKMIDNDAERVLRTTNRQTSLRRNGLLTLYQPNNRNKRNWRRGEPDSIYHYNWSLRSQKWRNNLTFLEVELPQQKSPWRIFTQNPGSLRRLKYWRTSTEHWSWTEDQYRA